jgi:hypothetical protein
VRVLFAESVERPRSRGKRAPQVNRVIGPHAEETAHGFALLGFGPANMGAGPLSR